MKKQFYLLILILFTFSNAFAQQDCTIGVALSSEQAAVGEVVDIEVTSRNFDDLVAFQYNHEWNPQELEFVEIELNPALPFQANNFNQLPAYTALGFTNFAWTDGTLNGLTLPDNTVLYTIRLEVLTTSEALVETNNEAIITEFVYIDNTVADNYYFVHGTVNEGGTPATVSTACILGQGCNGIEVGQIALAVQGTAPFSYLWNGPNGYTNTVEALEGIQSGEYHLTLTDVNGTPTYASFHAGSLEGQENVEISIDHDDCGGDPDGQAEVIVGGDLSDYAILWSNGVDDSNIITGLEPGDYNVTILSWITNCSYVYEFTIESDFGLWTNTDVDADDCGGSPDGGIDLSVDVAASHLPLTYEWSNGATTEDIADLTEGTYSVTITSAQGCEKILEIEVPQSSSLDIPDPEVTPADCNTLGEISFDLDEALYSFAWSGGQTTNTVAVEAGNHSVVITEIATGCIYFNVFEVEDIDELTVAYSYECIPFLGNTEAQMVLLIWDPVSPPYTFEWSTGEVTTGENVSEVILPTQSAHSVTITSATGCSQVEEIAPIDCGVIGAEDLTLSLSPSVTEAGTNDLVCLDVLAENYNNIIGEQFSIGWDTDFLSFESVSNFGLPGLGGFNFGLNLVNDGHLSHAWAFSNPATGVTLAADEPLFTVCWTVIGEDGGTIVDFVNTPAPMEIVGLDETGEEYIVETLTESALININGIGGGNLNLGVPSMTVSAGENFCLPIIVNGFNDVAGLQFSMNWDADALSLTEIAYTQSDLNLYDGSFNSVTTASEEGELKFLWTDSAIFGENLPDGAVIFELCFIATGGAGTYPVTFSDEPILIEAVNGNAELIPVTTSGGNVIIDGVVSTVASLQIGSVAVEVGEDICVPVTAQDFDQINSLQLSIGWEAELASFSGISIENSELPDISPSHFNAVPNSSFMSFAWLDNSLQGVTLSPGDIVFELCFTAGFTEGIINLNFTNSPTPIEVVQNLEVIPFIPQNGQLEITLDGLVWPGDTNLDEIANNFDLLNIGLGYGMNGPARTNASIEWLSQSAENWLFATPESNTNYKHLDTNGDGTINALDTLALAQNWGSTTDGFTGTGSTSGLVLVTGPPIYVQPDTVMAGATVSLPIILGTEDVPVDLVYGVAFTVEYDPTMVVPGSVSMDFDGWFGSVDEDMLAMYKDFPALGETEVALVRTDGFNIDGNGAISNFTITMEDVIFKTNIDVEVLIGIKNVRLIDFAEVEIPTTPRQTTTLVLNVVNTDEPEVLKVIQVQPVPAQNEITISAPDLEILDLQLLNNLGEVVRDFGTVNTSINLSAYPAGSYVLRIHTDKGVAVRKIIKI